MRKINTGIFLLIAILLGALALHAARHPKTQKRKIEACAPPTAAISLPVVKALPNNHIFPNLILF
jgi:hypothetical protein